MGVTQGRMVDANIAVGILSAFKHTFMGGIQGKTGLGCPFLKKKKKIVYDVFISPEESFLNNPFIL